MAAIDARAGQRVVLVDRPAHQLTSVPVGPQERRRDDQDILAHALDLLGVPQWEEVIVADGDENTVRLDGVEHVLRDVARRGLFATWRGADVGDQRDEREREYR